jgi:hypothetical protein
MEKSIAFDIESKLIKHFYDEEGCDTIIDLGCWLGVLAYKTYNLIKPEKFILIDAIPLYLRMVRELFKKHNIEKNIYAFPMCVVHNPEKFNGYFNLDLNNTIHTSNVLPQRELMKDRIMVGIPTANVVNVSQAASILRPLITPKTHLKIDIDSMDAALVTELIKQNSAPVSLNFECGFGSTTEKLNFFKFIEFLRMHSKYKIPSIKEFNIEEYDMIDLFLNSKSYAIMNYKLVNKVITIQNVIQSF